jgi:hypothetical protein
VSPAGRHLHWESELRRKQIIANLSDIERLRLAVEQALPKLPREVRDKVGAMLSPSALATLGAIAAVWGGSHWIGVGEVVDVILLGWGVWTLGSEALDVAKDLYEFVTTATHAQTDKDIDRAADRFARAVAVIGVDGLAAILAHRAFKAVREVEGGATGPRRAGGGYADEVEAGEAKPRTTTKEQWKEKYRQERIAAREAKYGQAAEKHVNDHGHAADGKPQTIDQQAMKLAQKKAKKLAGKTGTSPPPQQSLFKSKFNANEGGQKFTDEILHDPNTRISTNPVTGRKTYTNNDLGRVIGMGRNGTPVKGGTVVVEGPNPPPKSLTPPGEVVTQYPSGDEVTSQGTIGGLP